MPLYGTALLAGCHLLGIFLGELLGRLLGVPANVGGVGIAMLLLIAVRWHGHARGWLAPRSEEGVKYWAALYIPVVIAMAAQQNVLKALSGGPMAVLAAVLAVLACTSIAAWINRHEPAAAAPVAEIS
jgi:malonate transporter MadL subunit